MDQVLLTVDGDQLRVDGALNFITAAQLSAKLRECIASLPETFKVDLSGLAEFNSAVLPFMLDCVRLSAGAGKRCQFYGATPGLGNMLKMASLEDLIPTH
ncbi:MAG TPA: STAS domain-containing protein [Halioglobus sp.]